LRERLNNWLRRARSDQANALGKGDIPLAIDSPSPPLSDQDLDSLKRTYLYQLRRQLGVLHVYGLDERLRAMQDGGQMLDLAALYQPLNTTQVVMEPGDEGHSGEKKRPQTLLEAVGQTPRAIVRGQHGTGKSAFLRYLALSLATQSPEDELGPAWTHGWVFPVWVDLRAFARSEHENTATGLWAYVADELGIYADQLYAQLIAPGGLLLLLDGLEAAPDATAGFVASLDAVASQGSGSTPNIVLVTSQAYVNLDGLSTDAFAGFAEVSLAPWTLDQMDGFCRGWYAELRNKEWIDEEMARDLPGQLCSALRRDGVRRLAQRPSLMSMIALLHTVQGQLPADRGALYHELIDLTLATWSEGSAESKRDLRQIFDMEALRTVVSQVTYQAVARLDDAGELVTFSESDLRTVLIDACRDGRWESVGELIVRILDRPCLLDEISAGVFTYVDPGIQAYVAARHLSAEPDLPQRIARLAADGFALWRQVILFAISRLALTDGNLQAALAAVSALAQPSQSASTDEEPDAMAWRLVWLAGEAVAQLTPHCDLTEARQMVRDIADRLTIVLEQGWLDPHERAQAGSVLDRMPGGDRRIGVSPPAPAWCEIPGGPFWMGEAESARLVDVGQFWIARYPVTNAQYGAFVEATGHTPPSHWHGSLAPPGTSNHPVVYVTWRDVNAYCAWWNERLYETQFWIRRSGQWAIAGQIPQSWCVRLPTSAEWEKAARGGLLIPAPDANELVDNPLPDRLYPWGNRWQLSTGERAGDEKRCNVSESNVGATTPVGMYPDGASPYDVMDVAGNVWEWCLDWADPEKRYKIRRGGAFRYTHDQARCSAYDRAYPGLAWPYIGFRPILGRPVEAATR
jgi:formylglycine-generating enzyme required for sulfatase activity